MADFDALVIDLGTNPRYDAAVREGSNVPTVTEALIVTGQTMFIKNSIFVSIDKNSI